MGGDDHRCQWRDQAEQLQAEVADLRGQLVSVHATLEKLQRHVFGRRSEKMPRIADELRDASRAEAAREAELQKRRENAEKRRALPTRRIEHKIPEEKKVCPKGGGHDFTPLGEGKVTEPYELIPSRVERQLHVQEKLRCRCGETILTADTPPKVFDKTRFGPTRARTSPASTRSSPPARRTASTPSTTSPTCSSACRRIPTRGSTSCCRTTGHHRDNPSRRPDQVGGALNQQGGERRARQAGGRQENYVKTAAAGRLRSAGAGHGWR